MPNLTPSQGNALKLLAQEDEADFFDLMKAGASGATTTWLVKKGLATVSGSHTRKWRITDEGRAANAAGKI
jgi:hypothetical protein